jgi:hypothetical protein
MRVDRLRAWAAGLAVGVAVAVGVALAVGEGEGVPVGVAVAVAVAVGVGFGLPRQTPGPGLLFMKPETVPLNWEEAVVPDVVDPVVFTTTTKLCPAGTVNE